MKGLSRFRAGLNNLFGSSDFCILVESEGFLVFADMDLGNRSVITDIPNIIKTLAAERPNLHYLKIICRDRKCKFYVVVIDKNHTFQFLYPLYANSLPEAIKEYDELKFL